MGLAAPPILARKLTTNSNLGLKYLPVMTPSPILVGMWTFLFVFIYLFFGCTLGLAGS